jgi:transposase
LTINQIKYLNKEDTPMHYIGMDAHISSLDFAVINDAGRVVKAARVNTGVNNFMSFVRQITPPRTVFMEEGILAAWALEVCNRFGEKLVITNPKENHWIGLSGQKNDPLDALKLARLARGGYVKEVHHPMGERRRFRELMEAYHDAVQNTTRIKNKIKAKFFQNGVACRGSTVYLESHRQEWKGKLPNDATVHLILEGLWQQLKQSETTENDLLAAAKAQAKSYPEIKYFNALPGIGFIHAATISAILETPHRFADKRKVWKYAGLGLMIRSSGGKLSSEKLTTDYNRLLKCTIIQAAEAAIRTQDNPFRQNYLDMTLLRGIPPHRARLTIARQMMASIWAMWKKGEKYRPELRVRVASKQN